MKLNIILEASKQDNNETFVEKRAKGASEIAGRARSKGGYSKLTAWHFNAKAEPYREALQAVRDKKSKQFFEHKYRQALSHLQSGGLTNQKKFQEAMGELEVWGEVLIQMRSSKTY